ncbi:hypothetical protein GOZ86_19075 [Agrobacterium vitis]|uniref:HTH luxR-type domain-containing protein n=3 Tax=Agrobacterium vitis TaxID=373 RepID=A0AAE4WDJ7_AGRVI|nr:LuxR family transcriptional regulator [Agrobacterium vitis]MCF1500253.1 hypothetical protein [Allorhizobium sp. Av2]MUZ58932.1 hypothetical protein [Agrobacterium vitis]MVA68038.1 hypothetical protein [Agrobacterium vitis]MVA88700.1 hypothetical protein [Agrobacterium vitis]
MHDIKHKSVDPLDRFIMRLNAAASAAEMKAVMESSIKSLGYKYFSYHILQTPVLNATNETRHTFGINNYPEEWVERYASERYVYCDPIVGMSLSRKTPFKWNDAIDRDKLTEEERCVIEDAAKRGIANGLTVPLMSRHGELAIMTVIPDEKFQDSLPEAHLIHIISQFFHSCALPVVMEEHLIGSYRRRRSFLSAREKETVIWVSKGKSSWEIAKILGISEKSVEFYMESVKRKLEAVNRTQAVVKAIMLGLIQTDRFQSGDGRKATMAMPSRA